MEEKKNSQVQALDDDALENVTGGWVAISNLEFRFDSEEQAILGLYGYKLVRGLVCDRNGCIVRKETIRKILGKEDS